MLDFQLFFNRSAELMEVEIVKNLQREVDIMTAVLEDRKNDNSVTAILLETHYQMIQALDNLRRSVSGFRQAAAAVNRPVTATYVEVMAAFERQRQEAKEALRNRNELWHIEIVKPDDSDKNSRQNES